MPTYNDGLGYDRNSAAYPAHTHERVHLMEVELDFAVIAAARSAAGATALVADDVLEAIKLPAQTLVQAVGVDVLTAGTADLNLNIGDGDDVDVYHAAIDADAVASFCSALALTDGTPNTVTGYSNGKYYAAADTIDVALDGAVPGDLKIRLWALVVDCLGVARS